MLSVGHDFLVPPPPAARASSQPGVRRLRSMSESCGCPQVQTSSPAADAGVVLPRNRLRLCKVGALGRGMP